MSTEAAKTGQQRNTKDIIMWAITLGIPALIMLIPTGELLTDKIRLFLAITVMAVTIFAFENLDMTIAGTLLPVVYVVSGLAPSSVAFSAWTQSIVWLVLGGILIANALTECGLTQRLSFKCAIVTGGTYNGILWALTLCGLILGVLVPSKAIYPLGAFAYGICIALNLGNSKASAGIMMCAMFASVLPMMFLFSPNVIMMVNVGLSVTGPINDLSWVDFIKYNWPNLFFMFLMTYVISKLFRPDTPLEGRKYFEEEYAKLGKMSRKEKIAVVICLVEIAFLMTSNITKIDVGWIFIIFGLLPFFPGVGVAKPDSLKKVNYGFIIFVASCMGIGAVASHVGVAKLATTLITPVLEGKGAIFGLICVYWASVLMNFLLTPFAIISAFTVPFVKIAMDLGINPSALYLTVWQALDQVIFPYEYAQYLFVFSFGIIQLKHFAQICAIKLVLNFAFVFIILVPFWQFLGYLYLK